MSSEPHWDLRLRCAKQIGGLSLGQLTRFDQLGDLQRELRLQQLLFGVLEAHIGKNIAAANFMVLAHRVCSFMRSA